jgi:spore coat polysaccharide biosynthesis protein SpsF
VRIVAIVQARLGSTRLPGKVLRDLAGEPMLARVLERLRRAASLGGVIVATSDLPGDDPLADWLAARGHACFRGSEQDVLSRFAGAAEQAAADAIVRITADCPLIDPDVVDQVVEAFRAGQPGVDYACNFFPRRTFPRGLDTEILGREALERCVREATDASSREHVTSFIYQHPERFRLLGIESGGDYSEHRWTVDTPEDFELIEKVYRSLGGGHFSWREALRLVEKHPEWSEINRHVAQKTA